MNTYDLYTGQELRIAEKIQQRRLQLLVHSCIYYNFNTNVVSDMKWDAWAKELKQLQQDYPNIAASVIWHDVFSDWDGSSGAFLPLNHPWVLQKVYKILGCALPILGSKKNSFGRKKKLF